MNARLPERLLWLDVFRAVTVLGMIFVNASIYLHEVDAAAVPAFLLHSEWTGFTLADAVFPAFVLATGMAAAVSVQGPGLRKVASRAARLIALGLVVSNLDVLKGEAGATLCLTGVLQRIGLVYFCAGAAVMVLSPRRRLILAVALLALYGLLLAIRPPDGLLDLTRPGANLASFIDRVLLGGFIDVPDGPRGFDSEGLLSTAPAIAQGLIGSVAVLALQGRPPAQRLLAVTGVALAAVVAGLVLGGAQPISKTLWTPAFVLVSTGAAMVAVAVIAGAIAIAPRLPLWRFLAVPLGVNAIVAYVLQEVACDLLKLAPPAAAAPAVLPIIDAAVFSGLVWLAAAFLWRLKFRPRI